MAAEACEDWIAQLEDGGVLSEESLSLAADWLLNESAEDAAKERFLTAFHQKGESPPEIAALVNAFLRHAVDPGLSAAETGTVTLDVCGTGGDKLGLFNISTCSMFVLAAGGITVLKHGNRGITSPSGGADVLEALGVSIDLPPAKLREMVARNGIGFLFAPLYHPAFRVIAPVRKRLAEKGMRSVFNLLGPLLNPARPTHQVVGVFDNKLPLVYAEILQRLGRQKIWAVHGETETGEGMDEVSTLGPTLVAESTQDQVTEFYIDASAIGCPRASLSDLVGGTAGTNASTIENILKGTEKGPKRDIVALNAAAGFVVTGKAATMPEAFELAQELLDSGAPHAKLRRLRGE